MAQAIQNYVKFNQIIYLTSEMAESVMSVEVDRGYLPMTPEQINKMLPTIIQMCNEALDVTDFRPATDPEIIAYLDSGGDDE